MRLICKYICAFTICIMSNLGVRAQGYRVIDVCQDIYDLTARTNPRLDANNNNCALVKVCMPSAKHVLFDEAVGKVNYIPGMYEVYIPENTSRINYSMNDGNIVGVIDFDKYNLTIKGQSVYKVTLSTMQGVPTNNLVKITSNISGVVVCIDNEPVGQTPITLAGVSNGIHHISVLNTLGYDIEDQQIQVVNGAANIHLELVETPINEIDLEWATPGGDSSGWYWTIYKTIKENDKRGLNDITGRVMVPCEYDWLYPDIQNGFFVVANNKKKGLYDSNQGLVVPCEYDNIITGGYDKSPSFAVRKDGNSGYINRKGEIIIPLRYSSVSRFPDPNSGLVVASNGDYCAIYDQYGNNIVPSRQATQCDFVDGMSVGYYGERPNRQYFIMDKYGKETRLPDVKFIDGFMMCEFKSGRLPVMNTESKWGYIDTKGNLIVPYIYDEAEEYSGDCTRVGTRLEDGAVIYKYLDVDGNVLYDNLTLAKDKFSKMLGAIKENLNLSNEDVRKACYGEVMYDANNNRYIIRVNSYDSEDSYFVIFNTEKCCFGLANNKGEEKLSFRYDKIEILPFYSNGADCILATRNRESEVFDLKFNYMFSIPENITIWDYKDSIVQIYDKESRTYGYTDKVGNILSDCIYSAKGIEWFLCGNAISEGKALLVVGDRFGFIDSKGKVIVPIKYTCAIPFNNGVCFVRDDNGRWKRLSIK